MSLVVVDTNVVLVANGQHANVSPECVKICALYLQGISSSGKLALDDGFLIIREYQKKTQSKKSDRLGDKFVKWVVNNRCNTNWVDQVALLEHKVRGFESFPDDADLENFDASDRKFVAVSGAHPEKPPIAQAADSKWLDWAPALQRYGIKVDFLCQADVQRFHRNKFGA